MLLACMQGCPGRLRGLLLQNGNSASKRIDGLRVVL